MVEAQLRKSSPSIAHFEGWCMKCNKLGMNGLVSVISSVYPSSVLREADLSRVRLMRVDEHDPPPTAVGTHFVKISAVMGRVLDGRVTARWGEPCYSLSGGEGPYTLEDLIWRQAGAMFKREDIESMARAGTQLIVDACQHERVFHKGEVQIPTLNVVYSFEQIQAPLFSNAADRTESQEKPLLHFSTGSTKLLDEELEVTLALEGFRRDRMRQIIRDKQWKLVLRPIPVLRGGARTAAPSQPSHTTIEFPLT